MARPRTPSERSHDAERNARLADWLAREKDSYLRAVAANAGAPQWRLEDVVQSALLDFCRSFPGPDIPEKARAYCVVCVISEASKARRRYARKEANERAMPVRAETGEPLAVADPTAHDPAELVVERDRLRRLGERLESLSEDQRAVLVLAAAGYSPAGIAELRGLSVRQVRKRIEKANRRLREDR